MSYLEYHPPLRITSQETEFDFKVKYLCNGPHDSDVAAMNVRRVVLVTIKHNDGSGFKRSAPHWASLQVRGFKIAKCLYESIVED